MRKIKTIIVTMLVFVIAFASVGCFGNTGGGSDKLDTTKSQLYVSNYNGGVGSEWLYKITEEFAKEVAEISFENGKKGVQFVINASKDLTSSTALYNNFDKTKDEVFFTAENFYYDYVGTEKLLDIADIINAKNPQDGNKTIASKLIDSQIEFLTVGESKSMYALPHYFAYNGLVFDVDLFNEKSFFFAKNGVPSEVGYTGTLAWTNSAGEKSAGVDGEYNTNDDGLPATYDDFFALCGYMTENGVKPITWTGEYKKAYTNWLLCALFADFEGKEQMDLSYNFKGSAKNLITIGANGEIIKDAAPTPITNTNGYEMYRTAGRYHALDFLEKIVDNNYYDDPCFTGGDTNVSAQDRFLRSRTGSKQPIAMLCEGTWWENEAEDIFDKMAKKINPKWAREKRHFEMMPLPKATKEQIGQEKILVDSNNSFSFIKKAIAPSKVTLAKKFLQYCYTDKALQQFTIISGTPRAVQYDIPEAEQTTMSHFTKNVWSTYKESKLVFPCSNNSIYKATSAAFATKETFVGANKNEPVHSLNQGDSSADIFKDIMAAHTKDKWDKAYSKYFG